jgi:aryl-alcohol dehydrogenase-like predicted oxidoreductase
VARIAKARGITMAQTALAWVMQKQPVTAPIVGATKLGQLTDALGAGEVKLSGEEVKALEAAYTPRAVAGFQ